MDDDIRRTRSGLKISVAILGILLLSAAGAAVQNPSYNGYVSLTLDNTTYQPGDRLQADIVAANRDRAPIVDGYLVIELVRGCADPTYPSQVSNCDNVFHEEKITDINLAKGENTRITYNYTLPEDLRSGTYRVDVYFRTERAPISGIPHIFAAPSYRSFTVSRSGSGDYPLFQIGRTETRFTGTSEVKGSWDPDTHTFETTAWPSIAGPVGVLVTDSMETVSGSVMIQNHNGASSARLELTVCEWDDTHCPDPVYQDTRTVSLEPGNNTVDVQVPAPSEPGAYAVRMEVRKDGRLHSLYRNRLIVEGKTARIRRLSVVKPYFAAGDRLAVRLLTGTAPDHYTDPVMRNMEATVTVENLETGDQVMQQSQQIGLLSSNRLIDARWFNTTVDAELYRYNVSAVIRSSDGSVYDRYSYVVDASKFAGDVNTVRLESRSYSEGALDAELCGRTRAGVPAQFEAEVMLMDGNQLVDQQTASINGCGTVTLSPVQRQSYELLVNADRQYSFTVDLSGDGKDQQDEDKPRPDTDGQPTLLYAGLAVLVLLIAAVLYWRGRR